MAKGFIEKLEKNYSKNAPSGTEYSFDQLSLLPNAWADTKDNISYLQINAFFTPNQKAFGRTSAELLTKTKRMGNWKFVAPDDIQENISHDWGEYDSMSSRLAQKGMEAMKQVQLGTNLASAGLDKGAGGMIDSLVSNIGKTGGQVKNLNLVGGVDTLLKTAGGPISNELAFQGKIDTAFIYQDSKRREYTFTVHLADMGGGDSKRLKRQIIEPIQKLEALSCPVLDKESLVSIGFPAVFSVEFMPSRIISMDACALTAVTPSYSGPYIDGYPTICELGLTFTEIAPLYRYLIEDQTLGIVTTNPS